MLLLMQVGCVHRRLWIHTNPPGAVVYVDNTRIGTTPVPLNYVYYGTREIRLVKEGFRTEVINQPIPAPWWQFPGLDFYADALSPREHRDVRTVQFQMQPEMMVPTAQLLDRAEALRGGVQVDSAASLGLPRNLPETLPQGGEIVDENAFGPSQSAETFPPQLSEGAETLPPQGLVPPFGSGPE